MSIGLHAVTGVAFSVALVSMVRSSSTGNAPPIFKARCKIISASVADTRGVPSTLAACTCVSVSVN